MNGDDRDERRKERIAICVESGVSEQRAIIIAGCEDYGRFARSIGVRWYCECGTHAVQPR
jgi:hypothetical protein